ncbi:NLR family CARD domain-containing protein 3-like [Colossoma macropomum]|uniref:NLR family CARD domain-containing protein 3-like n=1 Tax=Colossoma macropomum TaxID=42526 RepID=UPI001864EBA4|nr:NLR family CARD domain-containing protein 3-like [Colossoma macropomum]
MASELGQKVKRAGPPEPSCVSEKRYQSMENPPEFSSGGGEPSCVSEKRFRSMKNPPVFSGGGGEPSCVSMKSDWSMKNPPVFSGGGGEPSCVSMKSDWQHSTQTALQINTLADIHQPVDDVLHRVLERHKTSMKNKYESLFEGIRTEQNKTLLNRIYTQLYIIEGESEGVNEEHEVLQMEKTSRRRLQDSPINCSDIFKQGPEGETREEIIRAVEADRLRHREREDNRPEEPELRAALTKGKANQDVELMFVLPFRELNLIKDDQYSLHGLLCDFHPELKDLDAEIYHQIKAVFIFDGLDESRIPLNFDQCEKVSDITMTSSVGVLMTNLIKGELLPSALIWITSRPAAANQIPPKYINRVTEIQGFSDPQKEEYFRKRISDEDQAQRIISHIKTVRSLHIMCHIPVFCWISATVLQRIMKQRHTEIPKTLTEMYSHFLLTQTNMKNEKYEEEDERDPKNLLEEECVLHQRKVYCFVHLSFQEFLAAVYVFHCYENKNMEELEILNPQYNEWSEDVPLDEVLMGAVNKAVESQNGHLDLFLRFLLGISLESNQRCLQGLLTPTQSSSERTREHIKSLIKGDNHHISTERSINLFLCLSEMNDQSLSRKIQEYLNSERNSEVNLSPGQCSALACMLLSSEEVLDELDLKKYNTSEEGYRRLIPALTVCRKARLSGCMITDEGCSSLASALKSNPSHLRELDLTYNHPGESGVKLLSDVLEDPHLCVCVCVCADAVNLTLDPNTVNSRLSLSERNRKVKNVGKDQSYPRHPDRFDGCAQVLSVESLTGRCYWEVQWSGRAEISVSYRGIRRKGGSGHCGFGWNNHSWSLNCSNNRYSVYHNKQRTDLPAPPSPSNRVGVYLDWGSGTLSFYTISPNTHTLTHLHTFTTTFTEPLYAGFWIYDESSVSLCEIE